MMTPAEFKATREHLGLTSKWLAERWGVAVHSVERWEKDRILPDDLLEDLLLIKRYADELIGIAVKHGENGLQIETPLDVPRTAKDDYNKEYPPAFWRMIAWEAADRTGDRIVYTGQQVDIDPRYGNDFAKKI